MNVQKMYIKFLYIYIYIYIQKMYKLYKTCTKFGLKAD